MKIEKIDIDNLKLLIYTDQEIVENYAKITINYGSNQNKKHPEGIAHFLEHVKFASPKGDYFEYFTKNLANSNAYTSYNQTSYYFTSFINFIENLEVLIEMCTNIYLNDEIIEKERKIIEQEINMYLQEPEWVLRNYVFQNVCTNTNYGIDIAGSVESINNITINDLKNVFEENYVKNNMIISIITNEPKEKIINLIKEKFKLVKNKVKQEHQKIEMNDVNKEYDEKVFANLNQEIMSYSYKFNYDLNIIDYFTLLVIKENFSKINDKYIKYYQDQKINKSLEVSLIFEKDFKMINFEMIGKNKEEFQTIIDDLFYLNEHVNIIIKRIIGKELKKYDDPYKLINLYEKLELMDLDINDYFNELNNLDVNKIENSFKKLFNERKKSFTFLK